MFVQRLFSPIKGPRNIVFGLEIIQNNSPSSLDLEVCFDALHRVTAKNVSPIEIENGLLCFPEVTYYLILYRKLVHVQRL